MFAAGAEVADDGELQGGAERGAKQKCEDCFSSFILVFLI